MTQVTANDVDLSSTITYSLTENTSTNFPFTINQYTGVVTLTSALDYEEQTEYTLTVTASDSLHQTFGEVKVQVLDVNDNAPVFTKDSYQVKMIDLLSRRSICQLVGVIQQLLKQYTCCHYHMTKKKMSSVNSSQTST